MKDELLELESKYAYKLEIDRYLNSQKKGMTSAKLQSLSNFIQFINLEKVIMSGDFERSFNTHEKKSKLKNMLFQGVYADLLKKKDLI